MLELKSPRASGMIIETTFERPLKRCDEWILNGSIATVEVIVG
jgi:hypothetical protein